MLYGLLYGFFYGPKQEEAAWLKLLLFESKVINIAKTATWMHSTNLVHFYPTPAWLGSACPNIDWLAALNGICTKRKTIWFGLLIFKNKVNNSSQTWPLIHLTSLATFYSKSLFLKWVMPVKEYYEYEYEHEQSDKFQFWLKTHNASFLLDTY